jgi:hypothetical protein
MLVDSVKRAYTEKYLYVRESENKRELAKKC